MTYPEPIPDRKRWYVPAVDPNFDPDKPDLVTKKAFVEAEKDYTSKSSVIMEPDDAHPANVSSSLCTDGRHRPALDIDVACELHDSSTPGHYHLYFPELSLDWPKYRLLLEVLAYVGILEQGYVDAATSKGREQTLLRLPGVVKQPAELEATA